MRRTANLTPLRAKVHITVTANGRVAGPFVSRKGDETALVEKLGREIIQVSPELVINLEVVGLMAGEIEKGAIAGEGEIISRCTDTDRLT